MRCAPSWLVSVPLVVLAVACSSGTQGPSGTGGMSAGTGGMSAGTGGSNTGGSGGSASGGQGGTAGSSNFSAVLAVFAAHCTTCHDATRSGGLPTYPALSLTAPDAHAALVNHPADETCGGMRVVPGNPNASYLVQKVTQDTPCDGQHMPRPFEVIPPAPLTSAEISTITGWISAGAPP